MEFTKFNKAFNLDALKKDIEEAQKNGGSGNRREVPHGSYEVKIEKMELRESKKGDPMVTVWFRIIGGEYDKSMIFMNQVITQGFQIHIVNTFLRSLDSGLEIVFDNFEQYSNLLMDVHEKIEAQRLEYALDYGENNGFGTFTITEVFDPS